MKTILPVLALVCLIGLGAGSSILYLNMDYITSALLHCFLCNWNFLFDWI